MKACALVMESLVYENSPLADYLQGESASSTVALRGFAEGLIEIYIQ